MRWVTGWVAFGLVGCVSVKQEFGDTVLAPEVSLVQMVVENGRLSYDGRSLDGSFVVEGTSYGRGGGEKGASQREAGNTYSVRVDRGWLIAEANSDFSRGGVDFSIVGPERMDTELTTSGTANLQNVDGIHVITARKVFARNVIGDVDIQADGGGVDAQILPYTDVGLVSIVSSGADVSIGLPYGLDYDLNVVGDPDYAMIVDDLGFDTFQLDGVVGVGWRGFRSIQVFVDVTGGEVDIYPL